MPGGPDAGAVAIHEDDDESKVEETRTEVEPEAPSARPRFRGPPPQGPHVAFRGRKGCSQGRKYPQANLTEIRRILAALMTREERVAAAERKLSEANAKVREAIAALRDKPSEAAEARFRACKRRRSDQLERVQNARAWREFTAKRLRLYLDHALHTTPYVRKCAECAATVGAQALRCEKCDSDKIEVKEKPNPFARAAVPILRHIARVLEEAELCFKIRARTSDADEAFKKLLDAHQGLVRKFGNPHQTALEGDDAEQGAVIGLFDGAKRFDPTKPTHLYCPRCEHKEKIAKPSEVMVKNACPKCGLPCMMQVTSTATYQTYAWAWTKRNSRARKDTEKRPGLLHASIDDPSLGGKASEDGGVADQVTVAGGRAVMGVGSYEADDEQASVARDLRDQIAELEDPQQRAVLELILEGCGPSDIAAQLGITTRKVRQLKDEAFAIMRKRLAAYLET